MSYDLLKKFIESSEKIEKTVKFSKNYILLRYTGEEIGNLEFDETVSKEIDELNSIKYIDDFISESKKASDDNPGIKDISRNFNTISDKITDSMSKIIFREEKILYTDIVTLSIDIKNDDLLVLKEVINKDFTSVSSIDKIKIGDDRFSIDLSGDFLEFPGGGALVAIR